MGDPRLLRTMVNACDLLHATGRSLDKPSERQSASSSGQTGTDLVGPSPAMNLSLIRLMSSGTFCPEQTNPQCQQGLRQPESRMKGRGRKENPHVSPDTRQ